MTEPDSNTQLQGEFTDVQVRRGLRVSIAASAVGVMYYQILVPTHWMVVGLMTLMGVNKVHLAILAASMPLARFVEILAAWFMQRTGRRRELFTWALIVGRVTWIPVVLVWYVRDSLGALTEPALFALLFAGGVLTWLGANAWLAWMGDLVPSDSRGRYFGNRQIFEIVMGIGAGFVAAWYLGEHPTFEQYRAVVFVLVGFGVLDILIFRLGVPHPRLKPTLAASTRGDLLRFIVAPLRDRNYRRLVFFLGFWMFSSGLMGPHMAVFLNNKKYLGLTFFFSATVIAISGIFRAGASWLWGQVGDRWSPRKVLTLCVLISVTPPFYYLFVTRETTWPIWMAWIVGSISWAGIFVYTFQYGIAMAPVKDRSVYLAFQSAVIGLVTGASYVCAGLIVKLLENVAPVSAGPWVWSDLQLLFALAGAGRLFSLVFLRRLDKVNTL